jgi:glucose 1-dehydrogenase
MNGTPPLPLQGRIALVTAGSARYGRSICIELARAGCRIAIHHHNAEAGAQKLARRIHQERGDAEWFDADLSDPTRPAWLLERVREKLGPPSILVNTASLATPAGFLDTTLDLWEKEFAANLRAPFLLTQLFAKQPQLQSGVVVNLLEARTLRAGKGHFAWRLTKAALEAMTRNLALELAPRIRVNAVAPGAILALPGEDQNHVNQHAQKSVPLHRPGSSESVARAVRLLCEEDFMNGAVVPVDGGETL